MIMIASLVSEEMLQKRSRKWKKIGRRDESFWLINKEQMEEAKIKNVLAGRNVDIEYDQMIQENWLTNEIAKEHVQSDNMKI